MSDLKFEIGGLFISNGKGRHVTVTTDTTELIFVKSGTLNIRVGEKEYAVNSGQWLIMPCGVEHGGTKDYEKNLSFFFAHFYGGEKELANAVEYGTSYRQEYFNSYFTFQTFSVFFFLHANQESRYLRAFLDMKCRKIK